MGMAVSVDSHDEEEREIDALILEAKWNMHGEEWDTALQKLIEAKKISIQDKERIDKILELIHKCRNRQKVELS